MGFFHSLPLLFYLCLSFFLHICGLFFNDRFLIVDIQHGNDEIFSSIVHFLIMILIPRRWSWSSPYSTWAQQAWPSSSCACSSLEWCNSSSFVSWLHPGVSTPGAKLTPSGCCSLTAFCHPPAVYRQRSVFVDLVEFLKMTEGRKCFI